MNKLDLGQVLIRYNLHLRVVSQHYEIYSRIYRAGFLRPSSDSICDNFFFPFDSRPAFILKMEELEERLKNMKVVDLKKELKKRKLPNSGINLLHV